MSGISLLEIGNAVPLWLQIEDGAVDQYPQVEVRDDADNLLQTLDLPHVSGGLYRAASYPMPNEDKIVCLYIIYSNAAHTIESLVYMRDVDVFRSINPDQYKATGFATENPPSQNLDDYKASGFATSGEYDIILADIIAEVAGLNGGSIPSAADVTAAIFDKIVEGTLTFNDFQRIIFAMLSGTSSGHGVVGPKIYKSEDGLVDRIAFTCDVDSNRLSRILDPS